VTERENGPERFTEPLDATDPRFVGPGLDEPLPPRDRRLVRSRGPGGENLDAPAVRAFRIGLPLLVLAGIAVVVLVFSVGLSPGPQETVVGPVEVVRSAVVRRPQRVCFHDNNPCAWLTLRGGGLVAFNTNGPLPQEYGREGVGWCETSGWFGSNATGSRYDQQGRLARGPAQRGLDRFALRIDDAGRLVVDFQQLTAGEPGYTSGPPQPPDGPDCEPIPFDRRADLRL
jgi:hypothetical protein